MGNNIHVLRLRIIKIISITRICNKCITPFRTPTLKMAFATSNVSFRTKLSSILRWTAHLKKKYTCNQTTRYTCRFVVYWRAVAVREDTFVQASRARSASASRLSSHVAHLLLGGSTGAAALSLASGWPSLASRPVRQVATSGPSCAQTGEVFAAFRHATTRW